MSTALVSETITESRGSPGGQSTPAEKTDWKACRRQRFRGATTTRSTGTGDEIGDTSSQRGKDRKSIKIVLLIVCLLNVFRVFLRVTQR